MGTQLSLLQGTGKARRKSTAKAPTKPTNSETGHDQDKTAMGSRNGKTQ